MTKPPKNIAASVHARLHQLARQRNDDYQLVLMRFANERLLYRLAESPHAPRFVLKGATLFTAWLGQPHRATRDVDLLGGGDDDEANMRELFRTIAATPMDDGVTFDDSVSSEPIREDQRYGGIRLGLIARIGSAKVKLQVDIGFGDVITPAAEAIELPTLLAFPAPRLAAYPRETVVAEKLEAVVQLGLANSRMKDFYDLAVLSETFSFDGASLVRALRATFERRQTPLPQEPPTGLTPAFSQDRSKQTQWSAFLKKAGLHQGGALPQIVATVARFAAAPLAAAAAAATFDQHWPAAGPWTCPDRA